MRRQVFSCMKDEKPVKDTGRAGSYKNEEVTPHIILYSFLPTSIVSQKMNGQNEAKKVLTTEASCVVLCFSSYTLRITITDIGIHG